ncbi:Cof-type HAD-IIB family hydrolase [Cohnella sp. GCM10027633]|uniref:Cof-type HAD-IIB family hydrolase n=1 Tax=unclassified Cohnella TaxID=2636738 RepID=UPI003644EAAA
MAEQVGKYKLLALDLDGTLLNDRSEISETNAEWIGRAVAAGITVCVSTGRGFVSALPYAEQLKLDTPMITVNGGEIWTKKPAMPHEIHRRAPMDADKIVKMLDIATRRDVWYWAYTTERMFNTESWPEEPQAHQWLKFGYHSEDYALLGRIREELRGMGGLEISNSADFNIEINAAGISKGEALRNICDLLGYDISEAVHVGDSLNDIAAIREAGLGVAMGNAQDAVKQAANVVTAHHNDDGVAQVIRQYLLQG